MKTIHRLTPLVFLTLICWGIVMLTAVSDPVFADDITGQPPTITKPWQPSACEDFEVKFMLNYSQAGKLNSIAFTVKPSYTEVSPEFTLPAVVDVPHPVNWETKAKKEWKTSVPGELVKIIQGTMTLHRRSNISGNGNMVLAANLKYYCQPQFYISNQYAFTGTVFMFEEAN